MTKKRTPKRLALIIASYEYQDDGLRQLVAPAQDAEALASVLQDPATGGFHKVQILKNAPSYKVTQDIEAFFIDRKRDDLLLLYYSGHGIKDEDGLLYFSTTDTQRKLLRSTAVSAHFVKEEMRRSHSRRQVLLLDCCYSGAFARNKADKTVGIKEQFGGRGRVVLTSSDAVQYSFEDDEIEGEGVRSVFTRVLVQGLETGDADRGRDGLISLDELYEYVYEQIVDKTPNQRPQKDAKVEGKIIIARNPHLVVKQTGLSPELQQAIESPMIWMREGAANELGHLLRGSDGGLALAAHKALTLLTDDDSRRVSTAAAAILAAYTKAEQETQAAKGRKQKEQAQMALPPSGPLCPSCGTKNRLGARHCYACGGLIAASQHYTGQLTPLTTLANRYMIMETIALGGISTTYKAQDGRLLCSVAIEEMSESAIHLSDRTWASRAFHRKAELLALLGHPNLVQVTDCFQEQDRHYMVMEFIEGRTLQTMIESRSEPFPEEQVLVWAEQLCDVLAYLHSQSPKIIYRDTKPANVMVQDNTDTVKLIEFSIARFYKPGKRKDTIEFGTDGYAPPEQYGKAQTDERSDVYALGVTLHQLLTLRDPAARLFHFPSVRSLNPNVSRQTEAAIAKAVKAKISDRHQSIEEMQNALVGDGTRK